MQDNDPKEITIGSRLISALINTVVSFVVVGLIQLVLFFKAGKRGGTETGLLFISSDLLWLSCILFGILGFILGPNKMADIWGAIFGTNKQRF